MKTVYEPGKAVAIAGEFDLCVVGGSCTGVFAAVRAVRMGLRVAIIEQNTLLGGMATAAQVNEWHSLHNVDLSCRIVAGLTEEVLQRLRLRRAVQELPKENRAHYRFNSAELACVLDDLVTEHQIRVFFAARFAGVLPRSEKSDEVRISSALIEDKSGRRAIEARFFIDASGDGDLIRRAGLMARKSDVLQPVTMQALVAGLGGLLRSEHGPHLWRTLLPLAKDYGYPQKNSAPWFMEYPESPEVVNVFGPRLGDVDGSDADSVSVALVDGRRQHQALLEMIRRTYSVNPRVVSWPQALGVRETWRAVCQHRLTGGELLDGVPFSDAIANGTYPVDIHHHQGTTLRYLDGREEVVTPSGEHLWKRWRARDESPECYHIPYRSLVPESGANVLVAGRCLDADREAYGAVRVMVTMNQTGEAAGVAAALALSLGVDAGDVPPSLLRAELVRGGSILLERDSVVA